MTQDSPCRDCVHRTAEEITDGLWLDECEEDIPQPPFGSEWGCWMYEKRKETE